MRSCRIWEIRYRWLIEWTAYGRTQIYQSITNFSRPRHPCSCQKQPSIIHSLSRLKVNSFTKRFTWRMRKSKLLNNSCCNNFFTFKQSRRDNINFKVCWLSQVSNAKLSIKWIWCKRRRCYMITEKRSLAFKRSFEFKEKSKWLWCALRGFNLETRKPIA